MLEMNARSGRYGRRLLAALALVAVLGLVGTAPARAASFPTRPISLIVPFPPGSVTDNQMRVLARFLSNQFGQQVVVVNKPGGSTTLGPVSVAKTAAPDGYTLSVVVSPLLALPHLQDVSYDPIKDFRYIVNVTGYTFGLVVRNDSPWKTLDDLLAAARAAPGKLTYATSAFGGGSHLLMEQLQECEKVQFNHIPYKGGAETAVALVGSQVDTVADGNWGGLVDQGQARLLLMLTPKRARDFPQIQTLPERCKSASPDFAPVGIAGPAGIPDDVVKILHDAIRKAMNEKEFLDALTLAKMEPIYMGSAEYETYMKNLFKLRGEQFRQIGLSKELKKN